VSAREKLLAVHNQRLVDRTIIGGWVSSLGPKEQKLWEEYVEGFREMQPAISIPTLAAAIKADPTLGPTWPVTLSTESISKWISRLNASENAP